ncbi:MAG: Cobalt-precorrin-5A hydrolase [Dehalococcoidia bacterium]|nr:Cobalt-precorrin-5A hydrolase [Bacillota bacterium]
MMAVVALTKKAAELGLKIKGLYPDCHLLLPGRLEADYPGHAYFRGALGPFLESCWKEYSQYIFIMATGIVVRVIAPLIRDKKKDPPVLVLAELGQYVIPLLSGHLGGANELAREMAAFLGGRAVLTTATDVEGIPALDDLARRNGCELENLEQWKNVALSLLEGDPVALYSTVGVEPLFPANAVKVEAIEDISRGSFRGAVLMTEETLNQDLSLPLPHVILRPRNIVIGVGCRKGKPGNELLSAIYSTLDNLQISRYSVACLASIDIKQEEQGLLEAARILGVPLQFFSAARLQKLQGHFTPSDFVLEQTGTGAVAEPAALLAAREPLLLAGKTCFPGITVAIVKDLSAGIR